MLFFPMSARHHKGHAPVLQLTQLRTDVITLNVHVVIRVFRTAQHSIIIHPKKNLIPARVADLIFVALLSHPII